MDSSYKFERIFIYPPISAFTSLLDAPAQTLYCDEPIPKGHSFHSILLSVQESKVKKKEKADWFVDALEEGM